MTRRGAVFLVGLATLAVAGVFSFGFPITGGVLHLYLVTVTAGVLAAVVAAIGAACPPAPPWQFARTLRHRRPPAAARPQALADLESLVQGGLRAGDVHYRLRPILREVARSRLWTVYGIDLDTDADAARSRLSPAIWAVVRPDREAPDDRFAPELDVAALCQVVTALEAVEWRR